MRRLLAGTVFLGGVLLAAGALLDWSGVAYSSGVDRGLALAAGVVSLVVSGAALAWSPRLLGIAIVPGVVGLNMAAVNIVDISGHKFEYSVYPDAEVGIGLYAVAAGGALTLALGLAAVAPERWLGKRSPGPS